MGEAALSEDDRRYLAFAADFERRFVNQLGGRRSIEETLQLAWELLAELPEGALERIDPSLFARYRRPAGAEGDGEPGGAES